MPQKQEFHTTQSRVNFVLEVDSILLRGDKTVAEAVAEARGDGTVEDYQIWKALIQYPKPIVEKFSSGNKTIDLGVALLGRALTSGIFYILLGILLLYSAIQDSANNHSSFTFLLTVLGLASFFFGTGSQAVAQFGKSEDAFSLKGVFTIYGGTAALALITGWMISQWQTEIRQAFLPQNVYARFKIPAQFSDGKDGSGKYNTDGNTTGNKISDNYPVFAKIPGERWVPTYVSDGFINVLFPYEMGQMFCSDFLAFYEFDLGKDGNFELIETPTKLVNDEYTDKSQNGNNARCADPKGAIIDTDLAENPEQVLPLTLHEQKKSGRDFYEFYSTKLTLKGNSNIKVKTTASSGPSNATEPFEEVNVDSR